MKRYARIKNRILGVRYDLSYTAVGPRAIAALNRRYRHKNAPTDILSFPLDKARGEILICHSEATKRAKDFGMSPRHYSVYLFIHGCLHLKGLGHGRIMERLEDSYCREFDVPLPKR